MNHLFSALPTKALRKSIAGLLCLGVLFTSNLSAEVYYGAGQGGKTTYFGAPVRIDSPSGNFVHRAPGYKGGIPSLLANRSLPAGAFKLVDPAGSVTYADNPSGSTGASGNLKVETIGKPKPIPTPVATSAPAPTPVAAPASVGTPASAPASVGTPASAPAPAVAVNVKDFGATGNGATNDTTSIKNAFAAAFKAPSKAVRFPAGTYYLGAHSSPDVIFNLSGYGDGLTLVSEGAKFVINTTGSSPIQPRIFYVTGQKNIKFQGAWHFEDRGGNNYYPRVTLYKGATALTVGANSSHISIDKLHTVNLQAGFMALAENAPGSTNNITINEIHAKGTMYPFNLQHQGNQVKVGTIYAENCGMPFFVFGVDGVEATVIAKANNEGYHSFISQFGRANTRNIKLKLSDTRPFAQRQQVLTIAHMNRNGAASIIENIDVQISETFSDATHNASSGHGIVHLASYTDSYTEISSSNHTWRNIKINGVSGPGNPYLVRTGFTSLTPKGSLILPAGEPLSPGFTSMFNVTSTSAPGPVVKPTPTPPPAPGPVVKPTPTPTPTPPPAPGPVVKPTPTPTPTPPPAPGPVVKPTPTPTPPPPPTPTVSVNVKDFGAAGNGVTNDTTSIKNAFAAAFKTPSKAVRFPAGTYYLGAHSSGNVIFNLSSYGDGLTLVSEGAKFVLNTTTVTQPRIFYVTGQKNIAFRGTWFFEDLGGNNFYPKLVQYKGAAALTIGANVSYLTIDKLNVVNMQGAFYALSEGASGSTHHITIDEIRTKGVMYAFNLQNQGNQVKVGMIHAENSGRPFFVYGVDGVEATVIATNNTEGYHSFIAQYGGPNTRNVKLKLADTRPYRQRQQVLTLAHLNKQGAASILENIDVEISENFTDAPFASSYQYGIVRLSSYASSYEEISSSNHTWRNIKISGVKGANPYLVWSGFNSLTPKGSLVLPASEPLPSGLTTMFNVTPFTQTQAAK